MKILSMIDTAYRATIEEQDDTSLWFNHSCRNAGAAIDILLKGNAVNYACVHQRLPSLRIGTSRVERPSHFPSDLRSLTESGARVFYVMEDAQTRGLHEGDLLPEVVGIARAQIAEFFEEYDNVWCW